MAGDSRDVSCFALLIGIDAYHEKPLKGCVNDVYELKKHLDQASEPAVRTFVLTASLPRDPASSHSIEEAEVWPTYNNVLNAIKQIDLEAKQGDYVYIHFSGHGTVFRPPLQFESGRSFTDHSTGELALNLLQDNVSTTRCMKGSELASLLRVLVNRKLVVTLVLDCCFSGCAKRSDTSVRFLDCDPQPVVAHSSVPEQSLSPMNQCPRAASRDASLRNNWLINPEGYTIIAACGPTQLAKEALFNNRSHGALSYFLATIFERSGGIGGKIQHIYQALCNRFREEQEKDRLNQTPMLFGNKNLYFLGRENLRLASAPIVVSRTKGVGFRLEAGHAHGICEGDLFSLCAVYCTGPAIQNTMYNGEAITTRVISVGAFTSIIDLSETAFTVDTPLAATALTCLSLKKFPIRLDVGLSDSEYWTEALDEQQSLNIYNARNKTQTYTFSLTMVHLDGAYYEIRDETSRVLLRLAAASTDCKENIAFVLDSIEHLTKFELVKSLTNSSSSSLMEQFKRSFKVQIIKPTEERIDAGCRQAAQMLPICSHSECLIEVEDGASLELEVQNIQEEGGYAICLHVYALGSLWNILNLHGDYEVLPSRSSNQNYEYRKGSSGIWRKKLGMTIPPKLREQGEKQCDDVVKVFLTSQPTSFLSLELPEYGRFRDGKRKSSYNRPHVTYSSSECWVAVTFRIRTRLKDP